MKKILIFLFCFWLMPTMVLANPYVSVKSGAGFLSNSTTLVNDPVINSVTEHYDTGWAANTALGWDFGRLGIPGSEVGFRTEVEGLFTGNSRDISSTSLLVDVPVSCPKDFHKKKRCTEKQPGKSVKDGNGSRQDNFVFINGYMDFPIVDKVKMYMGGGYGFSAWQIMTGFAYTLSDHWDIGLEYRQVEDDRDDYSNPLVLLGVQYNF